VSALVDIRGIERYRTCLAETVPWDHAHHRRRSGADGLEYYDETTGNSPGSDICGSRPDSTRH
jgi:hypothetical protein